MDCPAQHKDNNERGMEKMEIVFLKLKTVVHAIYIGNGKAEGGDEREEGFLP